jgi:hypothetical protein
MVPASLMMDMGWAAMRSKISHNSVSGNSPSADMPLKYSKIDRDIGV